MSSIVLSMAAVSNGTSALLDPLELVDPPVLAFVLDEDELSESDEHAVATNAADTRTASAAVRARLGRHRRAARGPASSGDMIFLLGWESHGPRCGFFRSSGNSLRCSRKGAEALFVEIFDGQ
jgi:hypothetical protein